MSKRQEEPLRAGDLFVAFADHRPAERAFIKITRVAKDQSWADMKCCTWAVAWAKRQPLPMKFVVKRAWGYADLDEQEEDHMTKLAEQRARTVGGDR